MFPNLDIAILEFDTKLLGMLLGVKWGVLSGKRRKKKK